MNKTNQILKNLILVSLVLIALGLILAAIGYGFGGCHAIQWGPDGIHILEEINLATIAFEW